MPINCTLTYKHLTNDTEDTSGDIGTIPAIGPVYAEAQFADGAAALGSDATGYTIRRFEGYLDTDGVLKNKPGGTPGMRVWANDPLFNLERLPYRVFFDLYDALGRRIELNGTTFDAPSTDVAVPLVNVLPVPGAMANGVIRRSSYAEDIIDSGAVGRDLVRSEDQADAWLALGDVPDANLPDLAMVTFKGHKANQAAMLATTGEQGDWVIRDDSSTVWVVTGAPTSSLGSWTQWPYPVTDIAASVHAATGKSTPVDTDELLLVDSAASFGLKKLTWANLKATVATYYNTLVATMTNKTLTDPKINAVKDTGGNTIVDLSAAASAVNYVQIGNRGAGSGPFIAALGADTNIDLGIFAKGIGNINLFDGAGHFALQVDNTSLSAVNYPYVQNSTTGNPAVMGSAGSDTNVGLNLVTQGTGPVTVNGVPVVTTTGAQPVSGKRITRRVLVVTQAAIPTFNTDSADLISITALAQAITSMTTNQTGTPVAGDTLSVQITDNGSPRALLWGAKFEAPLNLPLPITTINNIMLTADFAWNPATSKWRLLRVDNDPREVTGVARILSTTSAGTIALDAFSVDQYNVTALAVALTSISVTNPTDDRRVSFRIKDNGTTRALTWAAAIRSTPNAILPTATVPGATHRVDLVYDSTAATWWATFAGHAEAGAPTIAAHADAGTGASAAISSGNRNAMRIAITTGTSPVSGGQLCTLTYGTGFVATPFPICGPLTDPAADVGAYAQGLSTTTVALRCTAALLPLTTYEFYVHVLGA